MIIINKFYMEAFFSETPIKLHELILGESWEYTHVK